jgi:hypothetical protein
MEIWDVDENNDYILCSLKIYPQGYRSGGGIVV